MDLSWTTFGMLRFRRPDVEVDFFDSFDFTPGACGGHHQDLIAGERLGAAQRRLPRLPTLPERTPRTAWVILVHVHISIIQSI